MRTASRCLRFIIPVFVFFAFTLGVNAQDATPEATADATSEMMMEGLCPEGLAAEMAEQMMMDMEMTAEPDMSMTEEMMPTEDMVMTDEMMMTEEMMPTEDMAMTEEMSVTEEINASACLTAELSGANEVPGPGDEDGMGFAAVSLDGSTGEVCWDVVVGSITLPADAMHIHIGAADVAGDVVVPAPSAPDADGVATGCTPDVDPTLIGAIINDPAGYYVNVHTSDFPAGAIRGQLSNYDDMMMDDMMMSTMEMMPTDDMMMTEEATAEAGS